MTVETRNFINGCRNVVWLSGYARRADDGTVLLAQSDNDARAIPIQIAPPLRCPPPNEAFEVKCHLYSEHTEDGESRTWLEAYYLRRASVRAVPKTRALLNALRKRAAVSERPFASREDIIEELESQQALTREAVESLLPGQKSKGRDQFLNRVMLAGFLGNRRFIPPAEGSWDDFGSLLFELRQSDDPMQALRIHIPNAGMKFGSVLGKPMWPLAVEARLRVGPLLSDAGEVLERRLVLETSMNQIGAATLSHFAEKQFPEWWKAWVNAHGKGGDGASTAPAAPPANNAPGTGAVAPQPTPPEMDFGDATIETW